MKNRLISAANRLAEALDRENVALMAMDLTRAAALLPEKAAAIADLASFDGDGTAWPDVDLVPVARQLDRLALENRRLLERAITAQERVIGIVVRAAASVAAEPFYGTNGRRPRLTAMALSTRT